MENPCRRVDTPRVDRKDINFLQDDEIAYFVECLQNEKPENQLIFLAFLYTGFRRGELLGLEWDDIDFKQNMICVKDTSQYTSDRGVYTESTKTEKSKRTIKVPELLIELFRGHKIAQMELKLKMGDQWQETGKIFTAQNGTPMNPNIPLSRLKRFINKYGIKDICNQSLRHTSASILINNKTNPNTVAGRLGHSQTSTTLNIYAHQFQSAAEAASETLEFALNPIKRQA